MHRYWLEKAAQAGVLSAQRDLRIADERIITQNADKNKGARALTLADQNSSSPNDLYIRGLNYLTGNQVVKDPVKASELFLEAAELNHPRSQYQLGLMYVDGIGIKRDTNEAKI